MGLFSRNEPPVPETISDKDLGKIQRGFAAALPAFPVPWHPGTTKLVRLNQARDNAKSN